MTVICSSRYNFGPILLWKLRDFPSKFCVHQNTREFCDYCDFSQKIILESKVTMKVWTPMIAWHNRERVSSVDFQPQPYPRPTKDGGTRVATAGDDNHVTVSDFLWKKGLFAFWKTNNMIYVIVWLIPKLQKTFSKYFVFLIINFFFADLGNGYRRNRKSWTTVRVWSLQAPEFCECGPVVSGRQDLGLGRHR